MYNAIVRVALKVISTVAPPQKPIVFSGSDSALKLAQLMIHAGSKRPLLVTDRFLANSGMLDAVIEQLRANGSTVTVFDGVVPNPTLSIVEHGLKVCTSNHCDAIFTVGGGSAIDTAKVIAAASTSGKALSELKGILKIRKPPLPLYVVPTTSGTGSEVTTVAVISDDESHKKAFFVDPKFIPVATALDPELLKSLPAPMTAAVGMDALTHAIEAFTSRNRFIESDRDAKLAIRLLFEFLPKVYDNGEDLQAREMVALASFLAGYAFTKSSLGMVHAISHQISAHYNTPHGLANAVLLPQVLRFNQLACASQYAALEQMLSSQSAGSEQELAKRFIQRVDGLSERVGIPKTLSDVTADDFASITKDALAEARSSYAVPKTMKPSEVEQILRSISADHQKQAA